MASVMLMFGALVGVFAVEREHGSGIVERSEEEGHVSGSGAL
jgi:hypothetical protein